MLITFKKKYIFGDSGDLKRVISFGGGGRTNKDEFGIVLNPEMVQKPASGQMDPVVVISSSF